MKITPTHTPISVKMNVLDKFLKPSQKRMNFLQEKLGGTSDKVDVREVGK